MSIIDKVVAAVTPLESDEERAEARSQARASAATGSWLSMVLDHHQAIEQAFANVKAADDALARRMAQKQLAVLLTGHSLAEEAVLYPAMAGHDQIGHSEMAYVEQSAAKVQLAALEEIDPMSQDYLDKLEHVRGAVTHHVYQEESTWFPELVREGDATLQSRLTTRYQEEFSRYMNADSSQSANLTGGLHGDGSASSATATNSKTLERMAQERNSPGFTTAGGNAVPGAASGQVSGYANESDLDTSSQTSARRAVE